MNYQTALRSATRHIRNLELCQFSRSFHTTPQSLAKPASRPSPRVRAAQRAAQQTRSPPSTPPSSVRQGLSSQHGASKPIWLSTYDPIMFASLVRTQRVTESNEQLQAFMNEWDTRCAEFKKHGPWAEEIVEKHKISNETLYVLGTLPQREKISIEGMHPCMQVSLSSLMETASKRGCRLATIVIAHGFLGDKNASKHPLYKGYISRLERYAGEWDKQCFTILAMLEWQNGNIEKAQRLLESLLQWTPQPYTPVREGKPTPLSPDQIRKYHDNVMRIDPGDVVKKISGGMTDSFPGIVEACFLLGMIYNGQINGTPQQTATSAQYFEEAYTLFYMGYRLFNDLHSTKQLIKMTPRDGTGYANMAEDAAMKGYYEAWRALSLSPEETYIRELMVKKWAAEYEQDGHGTRNAITKAKDTLVRVFSPQPVEETSLMREEWKLLADYHDANSASWKEERP